MVRLRTQEGRDDWFYCHSHVLVEKSKYFADRLSENWPTCQILDSRNCVEVLCPESDFDYHVTVLRLLYVVGSVDHICHVHGVKNAISCLRVAFELGCQQIIAACVNYLEAVPWEEAEEEEILQSIQGMGSLVEPILARLQPLNSTIIVDIFLSAFRFATSSPPPQMYDLKSTAQEQIEYMLTEDDDAPLLMADDEIKSEVRECVKGLLARFNNLLETLFCKSEESINMERQMVLFQYCLSDMSWAGQILSKLEIMREFVSTWIDASGKIVKATELASLEADVFEMKLKVIEVAAKVLEAIACGAVILPATKRLHMVMVWLPFVRVTKCLVDSAPPDSDDSETFKLDGEVWHCLESAFVSIIVALPSGNQAEILTDWLGDEHIRYPDLTEAFEAWCYRSKVAKRRLASLGAIHGGTDAL